MCFERRMESRAYAERVAAERVDVQTAREMQRAGDTIIDVRTSDEYVKGHIAGAINIPIGNLAGDRLPTGPVLTACSTGRRGGRAADLLDRAGRTAFSIDGGTKAWAAAGLPIVTGPEPTLRAPGRKRAALRLRLLRKDTQASSEHRPSAT
jgi:rhodanese-related sulfurtransferase